MDGGGGGEWGRNAIFVAEGGLAVPVPTRHEAMAVRTNSEHQT